MSKGKPIAAAITGSAVFAASIARRDSPLRNSIAKDISAPIAISMRKEKSRTPIVARGAEMIWGGDSKKSNLSGHPYLAFLESFRRGLLRFLFRSN